MKDRMSDLSGAVGSVFDHLKDTNAAELLPFTLHLNASIIFKWIFDVEPSHDDVWWYFRNVLGELHADTFVASIALPKATFNDTDDETLQRLLALVQGSRHWDRYVQLAHKCNVREVSQHLDLDSIGRNLLFTFMLGSFGLGPFYASIDRPALQEPRDHSRSAKRS